MTSDESATSPGAALDAALGDVRQVLERDGFIADWDVDPSGGVRFRILAGSAACRECLVPEPVMAAIVSNALEGTPYTVVSIELPHDY